MNGQRKNIFENALCLVVRKYKFGTTKKIKKHLIEEIVEAFSGDRDSDASIDINLLNMSKKIYDSPALKEIRKIYSDINDFLKRYTVVGAMLRPGVYVVPDEHVDRVDQFLQARIVELREPLRQLRDEYEQHMHMYLEKLGPLGSTADYPSPESVVNCFKIEYEFMAQDVPQKLKYISQRVMESEREKAIQRMAVVSERIEEILVAQTGELLDYLIERLTDQEDGKRKKFASNMIDRAKEFFETLKTKNLTGSEQINELAARGQEILQGVRLDHLKDDAALRSHLRQRFEEVKSAMGSMIVNAPQRALRLGGSSHAVQEASTLSGPAEAESSLPGVSPDLADHTEVAEMIQAAPVSVDIDNADHSPDDYEAYDTMQAEAELLNLRYERDEYCGDHALSDFDFFPDEEVHI